MSSSSLPVPKQHLEEIYVDSSALSQSISLKNGKNHTKEESISSCTRVDYATALTVDNGCSCPVLEAHLPTFLDSGGFGISSILNNSSMSNIVDGGTSYSSIRSNTFKRHLIEKESKSRTISDVHFETLYKYTNSMNDNGFMDSQLDTKHENDSKIPCNITHDLRKLSKLYPFGEEEMKTDMITSGGFAPHFNPLHTRNFIQQTQNQRMLEIELQKLDDTSTNFPTSDVKDHVKNDNLPPKVNYEEKYNTLISQRDELLSKPRSLLVNKSKKNKSNNSKKRSRSDLNSSHLISTNSSHINVSTNPLMSGARVESVVVSPTDSGTAAESRHTHVPKSGVENKEALESKKVEDLVKNQEENVLNALTRVEHWLEIISQNRMEYWENKRKNENHIISSKGFCNNMYTKQNEKIGNTCTYCEKMKKKRLFKSQTSLDLLKGDDLIQCLDCGLVACGSPYVSNSKQHISQHFLISGHALGITCGAKGSIFSFKAGDFVYHPVLEREKERIAILYNAEWLGWQRNCTTKRSFGFSHHVQDDFVFIPDTPDAMGDNVVGNEDDEMKTPTGIVIWRGFRALYPPEVPPSLIEAGKRTFRRKAIFHGNICDLSTLTLSDQGVSLMSVRKAQTKVLIQRPIGLYNMGNTCYLSCVLQCLLNLPMIQQYFLNDVKHDHASCQILRSCCVKNESSNKSKPRVCIGCEMDKLCLKYFGSAHGIGMQSAFDVNSTCRNTELRQKGQPISPTDILVELWKCRSMSLLVGYEQRDAHEFLQIFLDILSKDCRLFHQEAQKMRQKNSSCPSTFISKASEHNESDIVTDLFGGTLRSVLICQQCGLKRSQHEAFLNISIPLDKQTTSDVFLQQKDSTRCPRSLRNQIDLVACLQKFVSPESLTDPLYCHWCKEKTKTLKQHTFSKLPKVLCLHLKRFDAAKNRKIDDPVSFPTELNMGSYFPHW